MYSFFVVCAKREREQGDVTFCSFFVLGFWKQKVRPCASILF